MESNLRLAALNHDPQLDCSMVPRRGFMGTMPYVFRPQSPDLPHQELSPVLLSSHHL